MDEPHAVVERQVPRHLPVVLHEGFVIDVHEVAFSPSRGLLIRREHAQRRVREAERRVERIVLIVAEVERPGERPRPTLRPRGVVEVAGLERVRPHHLRQADG